MPLHHDHGPILGLDDGAEVGPEGAVGAVAAGEVRVAGPPADPALAAPFGEEEQLLPAAVQAYRPALGLGEADPVQRRKPHQPSGNATQPLRAGLAGATPAGARRAQDRPMQLAEPAWPAISAPGSPDRP